MINSDEKNVIIGHNRFQNIIKNLQEELDKQTKINIEYDNRLNLYKITINNLQQQLKDRNELILSLEDNKNNTNIDDILNETTEQKLYNDVLCKENSRLLNNHNLLLETYNNACEENCYLSKEKVDLTNTFNDKLKVFETTVNSLSTKCSELVDSNKELLQNYTLQIYNNTILSEEIMSIKTITSEKLLSYDQSIKQYDYELNEEKKYNSILNETINNLQNSITEYRSVSDFYLEKEQDTLLQNKTRKLEIKEKNNSLRKYKR
jgi:hypothetical protein